MTTFITAGRYRLTPFSPLPAIVVFACELENGKVLVVDPKSYHGEAFSKELFLRFSPVCLESTNMLSIQ